MGVSLGYLFVHEGRGHPLVFDSQFLSCSVFSFRSVRVSFFPNIPETSSEAFFALLVSGILTMIIIRTLRRDIARYNADEGPDEAIEETGWKLVHGDVFRPPRYSRLFAALIGSGVQIFAMALITLCTYNLEPLFMFSSN